MRFANLFQRKSTSMELAGVLTTCLYYMPIQCSGIYYHINIIIIVIIMINIIISIIISIINF